MDLFPFTETIECPCKNPLLKKSSQLLWKTLDNWYWIIENEIWNLYYPVKSLWPLYSWCFFEWNINYDWPLFFKVPPKIFLEITWICNLKCKGCYVPWFEGRNMNYEDITKLIDELKIAGVISIQLLWWEPTIHKNFVEICKYIKSKWIQLEMVTNWFVVNQVLVDSIKWLVDFCAISIDGGEEIHDYLRWKSWSYNKAINAFNLLNIAWINTEIIMTINQINIWEIENVFNAIWKAEWKMFLKIMHKTSQMKEDIKKLALWNNEILQIKEKAKLLQINFQAPATFFWKELNRTFFWCPWWILTAVIDVHWNTHKCLYNRNESYWNVFEENIVNIWSRIKEDIIKKQSKLSKCSTCVFKNRCWWFCDLSKDRPRYI